MKFFHNLLLAITALLAAISLPACAAPLTYSAESIEARIVDAETKRPIEGVIVTANWELRGGPSPGGSTAVGQLMVMEALTDKTGRFQFPAWGPIRQSKGELHHRDPQLILFKPGYQHRVLSNKERFSIEAIVEPVRRSDWNGKTIELKLFRGTIAEYAERLESMTTSLETLLMEECGWKRIPHMVRAVSRQSAIFRDHGILVLPTIESLEVRYGRLESKCGSVKEFFRGFQP